MHKTTWRLVLPFVLMTVSVVAFPVRGTAEQLMDRKIVELVNNATFEVVVPKPVRDSLSYEKPLPMDLLPYAERTDKYYSIGTAFAIAPDRFVSADHVMNLGIKSQFTDFFLRDRDGKVYAVDKIFRYSDRKDFVVFSLKNKKASTFLEVNTRPKLNETVYAVGNALGEGIVIRDGLYTSDTPEELDGEWKWMRFSAAASRGNSGGPLLDKDGRVVGVVLRKSENENLNVALPIAEVVNAKENLATIHKQMKYVLDNMDMTRMDTLRAEFILPRSYQELNRELIDVVNRFADKLLKNLLAENKDNIFPNGEGSAILLQKNKSAHFPNLVAKGSDGNWDVFVPKETSRSDVGTNGYLVYGTMWNSFYMTLKKPDDLPLEVLYRDSKVFMDLVLKGVTVSRPVGSEEVKVTSLGKADTEYTYRDSYGRKWLVRTWPLEYSDEKIVAFSLPVPGGCISMMRRGQTGHVEYGHIPDLKVLADFIYVSYYGSLKQWREFLSAKEYLPNLFSTIDIAFDYNNFFRYTSKRVSFSYTPDLLQISEKSDLKLNIGYIAENGKTVWDVISISPGEDKSNNTCFIVNRNRRPPKNMSDTYRSDWENLVNTKMPYNKVSFIQDKMTTIATVYTRDINLKNLDSASILYDVGHMKDGNIGQKEMETDLDSFVRNMTMYEVPR
ncbi:MAG TPA: trypsin-like peptidase domain-containing protein [Geobacteraceae bacterium]|nr:trypsin-like peptidase domain-containing protein [Geobacteraceae bacterium]